MNTSSAAQVPIVSVFKKVGRAGRKLPFIGRTVKRGRDRARARLLGQMPEESICAEIGVWKGYFTREILSIVNPARLHLIDPWVFDGEAANQWFGGQSGQAAAQNDMEEMYLNVVARYGSLPNVVVHRATSAQMAPAFPDDYFDWIYIDGNHSYDFAHADLWDYLPKVRRGGFLAGDDYWWGPEENLPVKRAVQTVLDAGAGELCFQQRGQFVLRKV